MAYTFTAYWDDINSVMVTHIKPNAIKPELVKTDDGYELNIKVKFNGSDSLFVNDKIVRSNEEIEKRILFNEEHSNPNIIPWSDLDRYIRRYNDNDEDEENT